MKCPRCLEENPAGHRYCSACGEKLPQNDVNEGGTSRGKRIAARILSICSVPFGVLTGGLGLAMGIVTKALDKEKRYKTLSTLGIVFGAITLTLSLAATIVLGVLAAFYGPEIVRRFADAVGSIS